MTGVVAAAVMGVTAGGGGSGGSGGTGGGTSGWAWGRIFGLGGEGTNAPITVAGVGAGQTINLSAAITGTGSLFFIKNGVTANYVGQFSVADGDHLAWGVFSNTLSVGTVTVSSGGTSLSTFNYFVRSPGGGYY